MKNIQIARFQRWIADGCTWNRMLYFKAAMKLYNRQNELLEMLKEGGRSSGLVGIAGYPGESLTEAWKRFIFHQFHDDLTGTSIPRAYEFSWNDELLH